MQIKVPGREPQVRRLLVDTGSEDTVDDAVVATSAVPKRTVATSGLGRSTSAVVGPVEWTRIGPYTLHDLTGVSANVSLLGSGVLRRFHLTFDYRRRRMYLRRRLRA